MLAVGREAEEKLVWVGQAGLGYIEGDVPEDGKEDDS